jgi:Cu(I)/Ag(I) efflux system membrane fusion protein
MKTFLIILITAIIAAGGTWLVVRQTGQTNAKEAAFAERKPLYYQSAMHPWIKSDQPGRCTICGMELTPVYEGDQGFDSTGGENVVALSQTQVQVLHVETAEAKLRPLDRSLEVAGMIDDDATRHRILSAYIDGRVDKLHVNYMGAEVEKGQPLADFYSPMLLQTEREYRQLGGEMKASAALRLRQMGLTPEQIKQIDQKSSSELTTQILSPISGTVVSQSVYEGQYVQTGERLFEIADFSTMWFMFRAYEQDIPWIEIGQSVTITTPAIPGRSFERKITFIDPNFDEATRSTQVRVELPNPVENGRRVLLHRLYADGVVKIETPAVLTIPRSAIIQTGPEAVVYVDREGGAYARTVIGTGRRGNSLIEITSGLTAGDRVVTNGNLLIDGQAELNRAFMVEAEAPKPSPKLENPAVLLTDAQKKAVTDFVTLADTMAAALAADDLAAFNKAAEPAMGTTGELTTALRDRQELAADLDALDKAKHFHGFENIHKAREAFYQFSMPATAILRPLQGLDGTPAFEIWECPMVNQAIPDAPKKGHWIQTGKRPGANPYFGKEMLDCGVELKP